MRSGDVVTSVSVITVCFNSEHTIRDTIESVLGQSYPAVEYIIVDGCSSDRTMEIVRSFSNQIATVVSEPDDGLYHAMNKGIKLAQGEIICILNSDDVFADVRVVEDVVTAFERTGAPCVFGDLVYVDRSNTSRVVRRWKSSPFRRDAFRTGWHPPHPAFFVRRGVYEEIGAFDTSIPLVADYEFMLRVLQIHAYPSFYLPRLCVRMRLGGVTSNGLRSNIRGLRHILRVLRIHEVRVNTLRFIVGRFLPKIIDRIATAAVSREPA